MFDEFMKELRRRQAEAAGRPIPDADAPDGPDSDRSDDAERPADAGSDTDRSHDADADADEGGSGGSGGEDPTPIRPPGRRTRAGGPRSARPSGSDRPPPHHRAALGTQDHGTAASPCAPA